MDEVKIGIVGAKFAADFHVRTWKRIPGAKVVAVSNRTTETRENFMKTHGISKGYSNYKDLISDPDVELVDICLPNYMHAEVAIAAMEAGKDVICEKPIATNLSDAGRIADVQNRTGVKFFYAEDWIFAPALRRAEEIIKEGGIGKPLYSKGKESHSGSHSPFAKKIEYCGGGAIIHLGVHPIGFFYHLFGMPESVIGVTSGGKETNLLHSEFEGEDWGIGILSYREGERVMIEGNYVTRGGMDDSVEIYGSEGVIKVDLTFGNPLSVFSLNGYGYAVEKAEFTHGWTRPAVDEHSSLGYRDELEHFLLCVRDNRKQVRGTTAEDGFNILRIVDAIYRSNRDGKRILL